jgi:hypothetical protein
MKELDLESSSKLWIEIANEDDALTVCAGLGDANTASARTFQNLDRVLYLALKGRRGGLEIVISTSRIRHAIEYYRLQATE